MNLQEAAEDILIELTGNVTCSEIDISVVMKFLARGFRKVREWYEEPRILESVALAGDQEFRYVLKSSLARTPYVLHSAYADDILIITTQTAEADLLGLPGYRDLEYSRWLRLETAERWLGKALDKYFTTLPEWREMADRYIFEGTAVEAGGSITLEYTPWPESFSEMTVEKAIDMVYEYALHKTKYTLGRVRSKFEGGDLEFSTDGKDLIQEYNSFMQQFKENLERLDYKFTITDS